MVTAASLLLLAVVLVGPGPLWVARWRWLHQVPGAAIALWQAGAIAALVAVIGAAVVLVHRLPTLSAGLRLVVVLAALVFIAHVVARLVWFGVKEIRRSGQRRSRHRELVDLVAQAEQHEIGQGRYATHYVLADDQPVAYCLPGLAGSRVVVSRGTVESLAPQEFAAVLAHERAHLRARHDLVLDTFGALHRAFPVLIRSELPLVQSRLLVEMMADDDAVREVGPLPLARALTELAGTPTPVAALGAGPSVVERVSRLAEVHPHRRLLSWAAGALAGGLIGLPVLLVIGEFVAVPH